MKAELTKPTRARKYDYREIKIRLPDGWKLHTWSDGKEFYIPQVKQDGRALSIMIRKEIKTDQTSGRP